MRTRSILAIFVLAVPSTAFCQTIASDHQSHIDRRSAYLALGVDDPGHLFGEVGMSWVMEGVHTERSYRLGVEYANDQGHQIFGVKGGIQLNAVILCFRGSIAVYYDGIHLDPRIFPEIGVNFIVLQATFGWCVPKLDSSIDQVSIGRGTFSLDLDRLLPKKNKKSYRPKKSNI